MNKQRKTSNILNVFQYDETTGAVTLPSTLVLTAPAGSDNSTKVPTTAWTRTFISSLGYVTGNQSISITGDATGSGTTSIELTLANTAVTPGTYGSATLVPVVTVDSKGRITNVTTASISGALTFTGDVTGTGTTGSSTTLTLANSGVTAGTFTKVTVDSKGRVTVGASATTSDISEGTNLYYTDARVLAYLGANNYATQSYVGTQIANLVDSAPGTLDTLNELAAALGDDPNFATTTATSLGNRLRIDIGTQGLSSTQQGYGRTNLGLGTAALSATGDFATAAQGTKADTAHGWGNHASAGYLTTSNAASTYVSLTGSYANPSWITSLAYSKITGVPAFLTSYTETDTLASVTGRGATTSTETTYYGGLRTRKSQTAGNYTTAALWTESYDNTATGIAFHISGVKGTFLEMRTNQVLYWDGNTVYHSGNLTNLNQLTNGPGYITGITSSNVTTALGYTPYNNTNPSGYVTSADTVKGLNAQFLGTGSINVSYGYSTVLRNENGSGANTSYSPTLHMAASDTMWQIQGTYGTSGNGTLYFRQGYSGSWGNWLTMISSANIGGQSVSSATSASYLTGGDSAAYMLLYGVLSGDLNTYNSPGLYSAEYTGSSNRPIAQNGSFIQISDAGGTDVKTQWYYSSDGANIYMRLMWGNGSWRSWRNLIHDGNISSQTVSNSSSLGGYGSSTYIGKFGNGNGYYQADNWIQMNTNAGMFWPNYNGAHIYPNTATSYGSLRVDGTRNSWRGLNFGGSVTLMMNDNETGHYKDGYGWQWRWYQGQMFVSRGTYGGSTEYTVIDSGTIGSQSVSNATTIAGIGISTIRGGISSNSTSFYVNGDANTYYPVVLSLGGQFGMNRYSISRGYSDPAPWDPIGTGSHKGGLTLTFDASSDIAWGGNDKSWRIIQFAEQYTNMVAGMALPVTDGIIVWLRGGGAYYNFQGPSGVNHSATVYYSGYSAANGAVYGVRTNLNSVDGEIRAKWPIRGYGDGAMYVANNEVLHLGNYISYMDKLYYQGSQRLWTGSDGTRNSGWAYHQDNGTGIHWPNNGWHIYPINASDMYIRSGASDCSLKFTKAGTSGSYVHCSSDDNIGFLTTGRSWSLRVDNAGNVFATSSVRSPVYYDSNDTAKYLNRNTSSYTAWYMGGSNNGYSGWRVDGGMCLMMHTNGASGPTGFWLNNWSILTYVDGAQYLYYNGSEKFSTNSSGVTITGTLYATGDVIAYYSDARLKKDVVTIDNAISKIQKLRGVTYTWNDEKVNIVKERAGTKDIGLIAQEVEAVEPLFITEYQSQLNTPSNDPEEAKNFVPEMSETYKTIKYEKLVALLVEAIKEQQTQIEDLKNKLDLLTQNK